MLTRNRQLEQVLKHRYVDLALTGGRRKRDDDKRDYRYIYSLNGGGRRSENLEAVSFGKRKKGSGFQKLEIFRISDVHLGDRTQRKFTNIFEGHVDVVNYKLEECPLPRAKIFSICAQLSRLGEEKSYD